MPDKSIKHLKTMRTLTTLLAAAAIFTAAAQTTGTLSPVDHSVYCPSANENVMQVSYDNLIKTQNAKATITIGTSVQNLEISNITDYGFTLPVGAALEGKANNTQFEINVTGVLPGDTINTTVADLSGLYLYRETLPTATANPAPGVLADAVQDVAVTFSEAVHVNQIMFMSGAFMTQKVNAVDGPEGFSTTLTASILEDYWSKTETPATMTIRMNGVTLEGNWILPEYTFEYTHEFPAETAKYVTYSPLNDEATVWEVYGDGWGFVDVVFDGEVDYSGALARIVYTRENADPISARVAGTDMWGDWSFWDNLYHLEIPLPAADLTADNLVSISIKVSGVKSNNTTVTVPDILYNNTQIPAAKRVKGATSGITLNTVENSTVRVYNIHGELVKENISASEVRDLPSGIYIVNGKKIAVK